MSLQILLPKPTANEAGPFADGIYDLYLVMTCTIEATVRLATASWQPISLMTTT